MKPQLCGILLIGIALFVAEARATVVNNPWSVTIVGGNYNGTVGNGSFSYDNTALSLGSETLSPGLGNLQITMNLLGQTFHESDDVDSPAYPQLQFSSFTPSHINYLLSEVLGAHPSNIIQPNVESIFLIGPLTPVSGGGFHTNGSIETVPEPATGLMCLLAAAAFAGHRARRMSR